MLRYGGGALPVEKKDNSLVGMLTLRDISLSEMNIGNLQIKDSITKNNLITGIASTKLTEIIDLIRKTGIQRILIIDADGKMNVDWWRKMCIYDLLRVYGKKNKDLPCQ